jgi:hypothetical protein
VEIELSDSISYPSTMLSQFSSNWGFSAEGAYEGRGTTLIYQQSDRKRLVSRVHTYIPLVMVTVTL